MLDALEEEFGEDYWPSHLEFPSCDECIIGSYHNFSDNLCKVNPLTTETETYVSKCVFYKTIDSTDAVTCSVCEEGYGWVESENKCVNAVASK
ncbi:MAG: hypothetical protein JKY09_00480 [Crocinitomicaceae bacterium]|nr:hypothetical protein [Crocinitomicaceae bacterium]